MADVKITDNRPSVKKLFETRAHFALELIGQAAEGHAKDDCPV